MNLLFHIILSKNIIVNKLIQMTAKIQTSNGGRGRFENRSPNSQ